LHIPFKYLILYNNNNLISYTMKKNKKIPNTPKYKFGGFPKLEQGLKDYGLGLADSALGTLGAGNVIKDSQYSDTGFGNAMKKGSAFSGALTKTAAGMIPGYGQFISAGQGLIGQAVGPDKSQYDEQGNPINPNMQQTIGMAGQIGGMAGGFMGKYGGQMRFAMGGMNIKPNAEVEGGGYGKDGENTLNPDNTATQFNGPTHEQGGIQTNLDPGTLIFSNKIKWDGKTAAEHNKPYAKMIQKANKDLENSNLSKESKLSSHLNLMGATKASQAIFAQMEAKKQAMVQNYAKKMGVPLPSIDNQQMQSQGMPGQPQGEMPMAKHGGMMNKMAMGGVQLPFYNTDNAGNPMYAMGGGYPAMTNPYNNFKGSIPMYDDGGNMPLDPPTASNGTTPVNGTIKVSDIPSYGKTGYDEASMKNKDAKFEVYNNPDYLIQNPNIDTGKWNDFQKFLGTYKLPNGENFVGNKAGNTKLANDYTNLAISDYNKGLSDKQRSVSLGDIEEVQKYYNQGDPDVPVDRILGSKTTQFRYPFFSSASKVKAKPNTFMPITYGGQSYVVDAETYNSKILPVSEGTSNENVSKYFQKYDPKKHRMIDQKHVDLVNKVGGLEGGSGRFRVENVPYPKFTYNAGAKEDYQTQWKNYQIENGLIKDDANVVKIKEEFKYGGQMPKYELGGVEDGDNGFGYTPRNPAEAYRMQQANRNSYYNNLYQKTNNNNFVNSNSFVGNIPTNFNFEKSKAFNQEQNQRNLAFNQMTGNKNPRYSNPNVSAITDEGEGVVVPGVPVSKYETDYTDALKPDWYSKEESRKRENESMARIPDSSFTQMNPNSKNFDWGKLAMQGANFLGQNAGNIYDLTRKNEPLETYDLMTAKYMDPTQAIAGENYIGRQTRKAIPGLVGGNAGAAMNLLGANKAGTASRIGRLRETYDNANAQIANQTNQFNTGIKKDQAVARAANAAALENVRSQAIHKGGESFGKMTKSGRQDNMDQDTLKMFQWRYQNEPGFKKYIDNFSTQNNSGEAIV